MKNRPDIEDIKIRMKRMEEEVNIIRWQLKSLGNATGYEFHRQHNPVRLVRKKKNDEQIGIYEQPYTNYDRGSNDSDPYP